MKRGIGYGIVALAVVMLFVGAHLGGMDAVWQKASVICLECVGLG
ncbi:MAG: CD1871A family CXXC motif-containing protein [Sphaerochaetaceae bacterium]|jgi:hypothetical protein